MGRVKVYLLQFIEKKIFPAESLLADFIPLGGRIEHLQFFEQLHLLVGRQSGNKSDKPLPIGLHFYMLDSLRLSCLGDFGGIKNSKGFRKQQLRRRICHGLQKRKDGAFMLEILRQRKTIVIQF